MSSGQTFRVVSASIMALERRANSHPFSVVRISII